MSPCLNIEQSQPDFHIAGKLNDNVFQDIGRTLKALYASWRSIGLLHFQTGSSLGRCMCDFSVPDFISIHMKC